MKRRSWQFVAARSPPIVREPLLFLYPRACARLLSSTTTLQPQLHESTAPVEEPNDDGPQVAHDAQPGLPNTVRDIHTRETRISGAEREKRRAQSAQSRAAAQITQNLNYAKTLKTIRRWGGINSGQFQLAPVGVRRVESEVAHVHEKRDRKAVTNALLKTKGTWSYDWRVALSALKESTPIPVVPSDSPEVGDTNGVNSDSSRVLDVWDQDLLHRYKESKLAAEHGGEDSIAPQADGKDTVASPDAPDARDTSGVNSGSSRVLDVWDQELLRQYKESNLATGYGGEHSIAQQADGKDVQHRYDKSNLGADHDSEDSIKQQDDGESDVVWDTEWFLASVKAATKSNVPRVLQRFIYGGDDSLGTFRGQDTHVFQIRDTLMRMFEDHTAYPLQTEQAFNVALRFLGRHVFFNDARSLINIMTKSNIPPTTESFNVLLWGAAKRHDLFNFTYLLRTMIRRDLKPNGDTWRNFIVAIESNVVRLQIAGIMKDMGLFEDKTTLQKVARCLMDVHLQGYAERNEEALELIQRFDSMYETEAWFSIYAANKICERMGDAGRMDQVFEMMKIMRERNCKLSNDTMTTILATLTRSRDLDLTSKFLTIFNKANVGLKEPDFGLLFELAWSTQSYNLCRLIWSVACSQAAVTVNMQKRVHRSLIQNIADGHQSHDAAWLTQAGKVIVGGGFGHEGQQRYRELPARMNIVKSLGQWQPNGAQREAALQLSKQIVSEDLTAVGRFEYIGDFLVDFDRASSLDEEWKNEEWIKGVADFDKVEWKTENVIQPRFQRKLGKHLELYLPEPKVFGDELIPS